MARFHADYYFGKDFFVREVIVAPSLAKAKERVKQNLAGVTVSDGTDVTRPYASLHVFDADGAGYVLFKDEVLYCRVAPEGAGRWWLLAATSLLLAPVALRSVKR